MKFLAYLLIAANVALGAFYFTTQKDSEKQSNTKPSATLSNLSLSSNPTTQPAKTPKPVEVKTPAVEKVEEKPVEKPPVVQNPVVKAPLVCLEISQIIEPDTANGIQSILLDNKINFEVRELDSIVKTDYWILLGPYSSSNRTKLEVKNLKDNNIDHYVLASGPYAGAISLGLYSNKKNAEGEVSRINAKGFDSRLENKDIYKTLFFIDIPAHSSERLTNEVWNTILKSYSSIKKSEKSC